MAGRNSVRAGVLAVGAVASVTSAVALGLLARREGKGALQPINATSHWLNGRRAAAFTGADLRRTAVGYATHHAATVFWAGFFMYWMSRRPQRAALPVLERAVAMSAIAAAVDYLATPKRFTPGWEFVLTKGSMAAAYGALAVGLAAGTLLFQPNRKASSGR